METLSKAAQEIIKRISEIQIEALEKLKCKPDPISFETLYNIPIEDFKPTVIEAINNRIRVYSDIIKRPLQIKLLPLYQLKLCSYILYKCEDDWLLTHDSQEVEFIRKGIEEVWIIFRELDTKYNKKLDKIFGL